MLSSKKIFAVSINIILLQFCQNAMAYTQISTNGNNGGGDDGGPKLYKAVNFDLLFPKSFNSSENVVSTTPEAIPVPTKTATSVVGQPYYPLPQSNEPTYTAARAHEKQQEPILFVTPAIATTSEPATLAATSNEAVIYDTQQQNINGNKYNSQVVTKNTINMQQTQQQEQEQEQQQQHNDNNKNENEQEQEFATGRAVDYHTSYPFGQVITPLIKNAARPVSRKTITSFPVYSPSSSSASLSSLAAVKLAAAPLNVGKIIYPQAKYQQKSPSQAEIDKLRGKGCFRDRFSPSEGVASHAFKSNNDHSFDHTHNHHNHAPSYKPAGKIPSSSNVVNSYVTPSNLYAFPPNNVNYPVQPQDNRVALTSGSPDSYSWPASGSLKNSKLKLNTASSNNNPYQYNGPVSADYLPPPANEGDSGGSMDEDKNNDDSNDDNDLDNGAGDESVGVLPASAMDQGDGNSNSGMTDAMGGDMTSQDDKKIPDDNSYDTEKEYPTPPPGWLKEHPESMQDHPHYDHQPKKPDIEFVQDHDYHHQPDIIFDNDNYHHSIPSYSSFPIHHHYPEIIYDDHHHDHPHIEHPPPATTTEAPPPEPPPEPRVKKYSYFYIGRKLWYIPLYFTVWFSFYVLWLILKSIARHKVNLPNHYVSRRSVDNDDFPQRQQEIMNQLTVSVLHNIDKFKRKYKI